MLKQAAVFLVPLVAVLTMAPRAAADADGDEFLRAMAAMGLVSDDGPAGLIHLAHMVCK
jgi:hypothetical protein